MTPQATMMLSGRAVVNVTLRSRIEIGPIWLKRPDVGAFSARLLIEAALDQPAPAIELPLDNAFPFLEAETLATSPRE